MSGRGPGRGAGPGRAGGRMLSRTGGVRAKKRLGQPAGSGCGRRPLGVPASLLDPGPGSLTGAPTVCPRAHRGRGSCRRAPSLRALSSEPGRVPCSRPRFPLREEQLEMVRVRGASEGRGGGGHGGEVLHRPASGKKAPPPPAAPRRPSAERGALPPVPPFRVDSTVAPTSSLEQCGSCHYFILQLRKPVGRWEAPCSESHSWQLVGRELASDL